MQPRHCMHCGSNGRIQVQADLSAPAELERSLSKRNLRRADVYFMGVMWETLTFICGNPKCGRTDSGYGNYVTNLRSVCDALLKREVTQQTAEGRICQLCYSRADNKYTGEADLPELHDKDCAYGLALALKKRWGKAQC